MLGEGSTAGMPTVAPELAGSPGVGRATGWGGVQNLQY